MEKQRYSWRKDRWTAPAILLTYAAAFYIGQQNTFISGCVLIVSGVLFYLYFATRKPMNLLDFKAVFSAIWMITIGLSQFRLLQYQVVWSYVTWVNVAIAHGIFVIANQVSAAVFNPVLIKIDSIFKILKLTSRKFVVKQDRLVVISVVVSIIGLFSFIANVIIKGYIPFFAIGSSSSAYYDFYTRFQIFYVASLSSVGLSYYCLKKIELTKIKRIILWSNIILLNFVLPILLVQRGTYLNSMLIFTSVVYLQGNRKLKHLLICLILLVSIYFLGSYLRGFSNSQLAFLFQPKEITECKKDSGTSTSECIDPEAVPLESKKYIIPPQISFLYSYFTVSHDNFNSVVVKLDHYTNGIWQLKPLNVLFRNTQVEALIEKAKDESVEYQVLPHLNSFNLITAAYLDFGFLGGVIFMLFWSFVFGFIENFNRKMGGIFSNIAYGICLIPIALGFFLPWMSDFVPWLYFGSTFLMYLASIVTLHEGQI